MRGDGAPAHRGARRAPQPGSAAPHVSAGRRHRAFGALPSLRRAPSQGHPRLPGARPQCGQLADRCRRRARQLPETAPGAGRRRPHRCPAAPPQHPRVSPRAALTGCGSGGVRGAARCRPARTHSLPAQLKRSLRAGVRGSSGLSSRPLQLPLVIAHPRRISRRLVPPPSPRLGRPVRGAAGPRRHLKGPSGTHRGRPSRGARHPHPLITGQVTGRRLLPHGRPSPPALGWRDGEV